MKTDSEIQLDVIEALKWDPSVTHQHIGVAVSEGIVTLTGTIPSYIEKFAAEKAAQRVGGVKAVVEKMEVKLAGAHERDDEDIAKAIVSQFAWNVQLPKDAVKVRVQKGWVDLSGEVEWEYQRTAAATGARNVTGVKGVSNNVTIKAKTIQPEVVKHKIEEALKRLAEREARRIGVEVRGSKVILSGEVHSARELNDANWAAWSAPGVTSIENHLRVVG